MCAALFLLSRMVGQYWSAGKAQQPGAQTATVEIYGMYNGKRVHTTGDMNEYAQYLNRYGKIIFGVNENTAGTETAR